MLDLTNVGNSMRDTVALFWFMQLFVLFMHTIIWNKLIIIIVLLLLITVTIIAIRLSVIELEAATQLEYT